MSISAGFAAVFGAARQRYDWELAKAKAARKQRRFAALMRHLGRFMDDPGGMDGTLVEAVVERRPLMTFAALTRLDPDAIERPLVDAVADRPSVIESVVERRPDVALAAAVRLGPAKIGPVLDDSIVEWAVESRPSTAHRALARVDPVYEHRAFSFSQEGEDLILTRILEGRPPGFYVDVGAHHPFRFSNTYLLYSLGWRGINIDATPGSMALFETYRPEDVNLECFVGVPGKAHRLVLYNEPALNTASESMLANRVLPASKYRPVGEVEIEPRSLASILDQHVPSGVEVAVLNVDVEGFEQEVLVSSDWKRHRPEIIVIEQCVRDFGAVLAGDVAVFLNNLGYKLTARTFNSVIFERSGDS